MIITRGLSKYFDDFLAVDGVDLQVEAGEVLALLGPNGAGKTTTVRMLTSILRPSSGTARVAGYDVVREAEQVRASVGVLTEQHGLYGRMRAEEYLDFFGKIYRMTPEARKRRTDELLEQFGLGEERKRRIGEYSKGMRQKLALARALLHDPVVLLLDEPTSAMDPESSRLVRDAIHGLRSAQRSIIICTHNLAEAEELADQIAIIRRGRIIVRGTVEALKDALLGSPEYEVRLGGDGGASCMPEIVAITGSGPGWIRYRTDAPDETNPRVMRYLVEGGIPVVELRQVPRSLERIYLQAIAAPEEGEVIHAG
ncbi:MAG: ABC transporter ATP-binding protein [Anaerolineales bacterium]|nr:ABC transporter ATP-binding protein [Anaerolineales bacterium]